jgi:hypothetical protein
MSSHDKVGENEMTYKVKRKGKGKSGFQVELRRDGYYYGMLYYIIYIVHVTSLYHHAAF